MTGLASENEKRNSIESNAHRREAAAAEAAAAAAAASAAASRERAAGLLLPSGVVLGDVYRPPKRLQVRTKNNIRRT